MFAILRKVVSLRTPSRLRPTRRSILGQEQIQVRQIINVDVIPDIFTLRNLEALPTLQRQSSQFRDLVTTGVSGARTRAVDSWWADNGCLQRAAVACNDNGVDITVKMAGLWKRGDFVNGRNVIVDFLVSELAELVGTVDVGEHSRAGGVDEVGGGSAF